MGCPVSGIDLWAEQAMGHWKQGHQVGALIPQSQSMPRGEYLWVLLWPANDRNLLSDLTIVMLEFREHAVKLNSLLQIKLQT